ncbi:hypothetical protein BaRGS_00005224, partial [Batillaria attramentaria]
SLMCARHVASVLLSYQAGRFGMRHFCKHRSTNYSTRFHHSNPTRQCFKPDREMHCALILTKVTRPCQAYLCLQSSEQRNQAA